MGTILTGKLRTSLLLALGGLLAMATLSLGTVAQADDQDPPSRVARISYLDGTVSFQPGGTGEWGNAVKNRPVTIGDKIWVDKDSRAELQAGEAAIHLGSNTALSFLNLDQQTIQMRVAEGSVNFRVRELKSGDIYEVDTPNAAFTVTRAGDFRVDVNENGDATRVVAIRGEGQVTANGQTYPVNEGDAASFTGQPDNVQYASIAAPERDGLDRWAMERDRKEDNSVSARYVSRDVVGYSDLDDYGDWDEVPTYGRVWYPSAVPVGWAPYSYGYWNWVDPWGWTWVDYDPWGFAPFHYGRWVFVGSRWGWCPGPIFASAVYGPAFVGWLGGGWGFGFGWSSWGGWGGGIGWFPLGWGEPFNPWFRCSPTFIRNVNITNITVNNFNVNSTHFNNFAFAHNVNAVTVASRTAFTSGQMINRGAVHITEASLRNAKVEQRAGFSPTRQSFLGAGARGNGHVATPAVAVEHRAVLARATPATRAASLPVHTMNRAAVAGNGRVAAGASARVAARPEIGRTAQSEAAVQRNNASLSNSARASVAGRGRFNGNANRPPAANRPAGASQPAASRPGMADRPGAANRPAGAGRNMEMPNRGPVTNAPNSPARQMTVTPRQRELSLDKPPSAQHGGSAPFSNAGANRGMANSNQPPRTWAAQGTATDRGRAPAGFGRGSQPSAEVPRTARMTETDRPPWARSNGSAASAPRVQNFGSGRGTSDMVPRTSSRPAFADQNRPSDRSNSSSPRGWNVPQSSGGGNRSYQPPARSERPAPSYNNSYSNRGYDNRGFSQQRSYEPPARSYSPQRSYSAPERSYSAPSRSYSEPSRGYSAPSRSYSAPSRSYSAPSRSYSAPSHSSGAGGYRGGGYQGGGGNQGSGGGSHNRH